MSSNYKGGTPQQRPQQQSGSHSQLNWTPLFKQGSPLRTDNCTTDLLFDGFHVTSWRPCRWTGTIRFSPLEVNFHFYQTMWADFLSLCPPTRRQCEQPMGALISMGELELWSGAFKNWNERLGTSSSRYVKQYSLGAKTLIWMKKPVDYGFNFLPIMHNASVLAWTQKNWNN